MKKIAMLVLVCALTLSTLALTVFAGRGGYTPTGEPCNIDVQIKKTDPSLVIKDGIISDGEYEKVVIEGLNDSEELSVLCMNWGSEEYFEDVAAMLESEEYYLSWDDVHGFNFAVKFRTGVDGNGCQQVYPQPEADDQGRLQDESFMSNVGVNFYSGYGLEDPLLGRFYYSVAKSTIDGSSIVGHWNQLGFTGTFPTPVMGTDYVINYLGDGWVICEWSIGIQYISEDGKTMDFSITTTAGTATPDENDDYETLVECWSVNFGQRGFLCKYYDYNELAKGTFVDEMIEYGGGDTGNGGGTTGGGDDTGNNTGSESETQLVTQIGTNEQGESQIIIVDDDGETRVAETDANGEVVVPDAGNNNGGGQATNAAGGRGGNSNASQTFDPIIVAGVAAAIGAAGIAISKKRK